MKIAIRLSLFIIAVPVLSISAFSQIPTQSKAPGTIAGRVTVGDQPVQGVEVMIRPGGNNMVNDMLQSAPATTAITDANGWYRLTNVAPGSYRISAYAPAFVIEGEKNPFTPGKTVNLAEGENIDNVNFSMTRGGVVTGQVTDPDGRPVIAETVRAYKLDENGKRQTSRLPDFSRWQTDDRGVYRIYGLESGRYLIAAGPSSEEVSLNFGGSGATYKLTYHPDAAEESKAKIIEISPGSEAENVDIRLERASKSKGYVATGRVIEAESGKPVAGVMIGYGVTKTGAASFGFGNAATNSQGEFRLEGLTPNSYQAFVVGLDQTENYAEPLAFEVGEGDVTGLEIRMNRGASISGMAVIEGSNDPKLYEKLAKAQIMALPLESGGQRMVSNIFGGTGQIGANGSFKLGGVAPGKVRLMANLFMAEKGFALLRVEHNGVEVKEIQLNAGDRLTGVRMVFTYGSASIAGRVEIRGGILPPNTRLSVSAVREGAARNDFGTSMAEVDSRGQFLIEGLSQGTYKLTLGELRYTAEPSKLPKVEQVVSVANSGRQETVLVLDLSKKEGQ
ncbi:MAG: collagen binding domain-containing protein [Blastocatellales bacterium]